MSTICINHTGLESTYEQFSRDMCAMVLSNPYLTLQVSSLENWQFPLKKCCRRTPAHHGGLLRRQPSTLPTSTILKDLLCKAHLRHRVEA